MGEGEDMLAEYAPAEGVRVIRNPYYNKLVTKVEMDIGNDDLALFEEIAQNRGITVQSLLLHMVWDYVELLKKGKG